MISGVIVVGLFADNPIPMETTSGRSGLFKGLLLFLNIQQYITTSLPGNRYFATKTNKI